MGIEKTMSQMPKKKQISRFMAGSRVVELVGFDLGSRVGRGTVAFCLPLGRIGFCCRRVPFAGILDGYYKMTLHAPVIAQRCWPGQFVFIRVGSGTAPLLRP